MAAGPAIALANGVLGKLGEIVAQQALNEASLVIYFRQEFQWLQTKLTDISCYLQYADEQTSLNASVKRWLSEVSDIALDAEDVIDECAVEPLYRKPTQSCVYNCSQLGFRYKMGKSIKDIKERVRSVMEKAGELNLVRQVLQSNQPSTSTAESGAELRRGSLLETDSRVVAMEDRAREIVRLLDEPAVAVVAVVGMGGLGKTLLLQNVYDKVKQRYEHSAWISVSQTCSLRNLQCDIARQTNLTIEGGITDVLVAQLIHEHLWSKKCLIVLDDVWRRSVQGNLIYRLGLPTGTNNQCKIVVTTRDKVVAEHMRAHYVYEMQLLSEEDSWNLFCLFAFPSIEGNRPPEHLKSLAHQIVKKCGRLPLAVKTVAASMAGSLAVEDWKLKLGKLKDVDVGEEGSTMQILKLSYDSLPSSLKSCFAYFSFFPEDTKIYFSRMKGDENIYEDYLISLWMAEGFIPQGRWHVGLNYLHQLADLCLLEVNNYASCYTVHDLLHDLAINISREHKCEFHLPLQKTTYRRLLLGKKGIASDAISAGRVHCQGLLRTLSFSQNKEITGIPQHLFDHLKVLRVLDLSSTAISTLPKYVGKLKLLKVLNLSETEIMEMPDCVRKLKNLEYLDVSRCMGIQRLPDWIGEVQSLSHLDTSGCSGELIRHIPREISKLSNLRTLRSDPFPLRALISDPFGLRSAPFAQTPYAFPLSTEENGILDVQSVGRLTNLEEISFCVPDSGVLTSLEAGALQHLVKMRILRVSNVSSVEQCDLPAFPFRVFTDLQHLDLYRFSVPNWICGMVNLTELYLSQCSCPYSLQQLPNLRSLFLADDFRCYKLPKKFGEGGGFPKLVRLGVFDFSLLEELPALEEGAMQCLVWLMIIRCPLVKKVPEGLERLRRLKTIGVEEPSDEWKERLEEGGEDRKKLKARNPNIQIEVC